MSTTPDPDRLCAVCGQPFDGQPWVLVHDHDAGLDEIAFVHQGCFADLPERDKEEEVLW